MASEYYTLDNNPITILDTPVVIEGSHFLPQARITIAHTTSFDNHSNDKIITLIITVIRNSFSETCSLYLMIYHDVSIADNDYLKNYKSFVKYFNIKYLKYSLTHDNDISPLVVSLAYKKKITNKYLKHHNEMIFSVKVEPPNILNSNSDSSFNFCFTTKYNNNSITPRSIKKKNNDKEDNDKNIEELSNGEITYPNEPSKRIYKKGPIQNIDCNINNINLILWHIRFKTTILRKKRNNNINCEDCKFTNNKSTITITNLYKLISFDHFKPTPSFSGYKILYNVYRGSQYKKNAGKKSNKGIPPKQNDCTERINHTLDNGFFLGYFFSTLLGYRVLNIISKSLIIICDAYFNESTLDSLDTSYFRSLNPLDKRSEGETIVQTEYINSVDNIDLMNEYNNENIIDPPYIKWFPQIKEQNKIIEINVITPNKSYKIPIIPAILSENPTEADLNATFSTTETEYSKLFNKNIRINIRIDYKPCKDIAENEK
ncbi:hypothetical protein H8356DRAFT_1337800 [Neocallimastix lanati (nom. inval.)]|nr:hypothetical protein H8356DRAFT_1337800 [Neocallimastix sp. JGI-2020a]